MNSKQSRASKARRKITNRYEPLDPARPMPDGTWYVLRVTSSREFMAAHWLESRDWFSMVPTRMISVRKNRACGKSKTNTLTIQIPEMPGFVFAWHPGPIDWQQFNRVKYIYGPLNDRGVPLPVKRSQIERFQKAADAYRTKMAMRENLKPGGKARLLSGPFAGQELDLTKIRGEVAEYLAPLFGGVVKGRAHVDQLESVPSP